MKKYLTNKYIIMIIVILLSGLSVGTIILISKNDSKKENLPIEDNKKTNIKDKQSNNDKSDDEKVSEAENKNKDEISDTISDKNDADKNANNNINSNNSETSSSQNKNNANGSNNNNNNKTNNNDQTPNKGNNVPQPSPSPKPTSSTSPTSPSSSPTPTVTPTPSPSAIPTPSESPSAKTQAEKNDEYRKQIQDKYSVSIAYKDELGDYYMNGPRPVKQTDDSTIYSYLQRIENVLNKYPTNFFKEIKNTRMNLTIYMVKSIDIGVAGLTNSSNRSNVIIMINTISITSFETTLHHEIMHFIDSYISFNLGSGVIEKSMVSVNPSGFTYGSSDSSYVYDYYNASTASTAYFLSNYSKTNYLEDRAVIFASLMTSTMKYPYLNNGTPIYKKARLISNQLRDNFNSVKNSSNLYWERLLK